MANLFEEDRKKAMNIDLEKACSDPNEFKKFIGLLRTLKENDPFLLYGVGELRRRLLWKQGANDETMLTKIPFGDVPKTLDMLEKSGPVRIQEKMLAKKTAQQNPST